MTTAGTVHVDYRRLMKKVEQVVEAVDRADDVGDTIRTVIDNLISEFRSELGIFGGRAYRRSGSSYFLEATFGEAKELPDGLKISDSYPPVREVLDRGVVLMGGDDPLRDAGIEERIGAEEFAAIEIGQGDFLIAFDLVPGSLPEDVVFSLGIIRHSVNQKIRQERLTGIFDEARRIQRSILPKRSPEFGPFDLWGQTESMEGMGGDYFDYIPITDKILGLAIADVSGHGLPAALQVRDIYMGLRMGLSRDFKIVRTVERLNSIIHHSTLTSRFVSMFYGELEPTGVFIYVNAGHPPPFHLIASGKAVPLTEGGAVLGPLSKGTYERGFIRMQPGDLIVAFTDGILEVSRGERNVGAEEYGVERVLETARRYRELGAEEIVEAILEDVRRFSGGRPPDDDRTLAVVKHAGE